MTLLELGCDILLLILQKDLLAHSCRRSISTSLLLPMDRLSLEILQLAHMNTPILPLCLSPNSWEVQVLSGQATACTDSRVQTPPRIFELCHISSGIRRLVLESPLLWASQAMCWPPHIELIVERAEQCALSLVADHGLCACSFADIRSLIKRCKIIGLTLPSTYVRADGASLLTSNLIWSELLRATQLTDVELCLDGLSSATLGDVPPNIMLPHLRRARLQNTNFLLASPALQILHIASEPQAPSFTLQDILLSLRASPLLRELVIQDSVRQPYSMPWDVGVPDGMHLQLDHLEHFTCSGTRGIARNILYWVQVPVALDVHLDVALKLGSIGQPLIRLPPQFRAECCFLLNPANVAVMLDHIRMLTALDAAGVPFDAAPPYMAEDHVITRLTHLALNIIPDYESRDPQNMWPRLVTLVAATDYDGAIRALSPHGDPVCLGPERARRILTMRNQHASFPNQHQIPIREGFPRDRRPTHLGIAVALPLAAYLGQADAVVTNLVFGGTSWVPRTDNEWSCILVDLPHLQVIDVLSPAEPECVKGLAKYLQIHHRSPELLSVSFRLYTLQPEAKQSLLAELSRTFVTAAGPQEYFPHIVWTIL